MGEKSSELEDLCYTVNYYPRNLGFGYQLSSIPYIISTRRNRNLLNNLLNIDAPILFDGLHTTFCIDHPGLKYRKKIVRTHNVEHQYYKTLYRDEQSLWKKFYFYIESLKLNNYEKILNKNISIASISLKDYNYFEAKYGNAFFLPASHPFTKVESLSGYGKYILFHGNLMVSENIQIAEWIIREIAPHIHFPIYIAGKSPSPGLMKMSNAAENVKIVANPDNEAMHKLIQEAHINLLPLFETSGLKLKLLYALYCGRHCLVNSIMTEGTLLDSICIKTSSAKEMVSAIERLFNEPFTNEMIEERNNLLAENYDNQENAKKIIAMFYE
jgi:hypothetical protein